MSGLFAGQWMQEAFQVFAVPMMIARSLVTRQRGEQCGQPATGSEAAVWA